MEIYGFRYKFKSIFDVFFIDRVKIKMHVLPCVVLSLVFR